MTDFFIGQIFIDEYPVEAADWVNKNNCYIDPIEPENGHQRFQIFGIPLPTAADRKKAFLQDFFKVKDIGYYRRKPKGYQSAIESINTAFNICAKTGSLPADALIFYPEPNFKKEEECTEQWLISHQIKLPAMNEAEFGALYIAFVTAWNKEEH